MAEDWAATEQALLEALRNRVDKLIDHDFKVAGSTADPQTIYHYTDVKGALGIITTGRLWFTERAHMNDPVEIKFGLDTAHELFEIAANNRGPAIPKDAASHLKGEHALGLEINGFWIASFSLNADHLGQWRNYADDGRGVCLGFSIEHFDMVKLANLLPIPANSLRFPIRYDKDALRTRLEAHVNLGLDVLATANLPTRPSYYQPYGRALLCERDCFRILNNGFFANSLMRKHPAYADEQEYRLLISGDRDTISRCDLHCLRERKGEIVGYLNLPIPSWQQRGVLTHIRLGPAAPDGLRDHIRIALMTLGIPTLNIDKSDIPFRPTRWLNWSHTSAAWFIHSREQQAELRKMIVSGKCRGGFLSACRAGS